MLIDNSGGKYILGVRTPDQYAIDKRYPLIIYLHGGIGTQRNDKGGKAWNMLAPLADSIDLFLASPSGNRHAPWWSAAGLRRILQSVRFMTIHYPIDREKIFVAGVSDGATGCYAVANAIPAPFAGFFAISGFGGMLPRLGMTLYPDNLKQRSIYNVNAGKDRLYPLEYVTEFLDQLENAGVPVIRKMYPDEQHGFDYRAREFPALLSFIRTWSRPSRPGVFWTILPSVPNRADNLLSWESPNSQKKARIAGHWDNDTLSLQSENLAAADILSMKPSPIFASGAAASRPRKIRSRKMSTGIMLDIMQHACFPAVGDTEIYELKLR